MFTSEQTEVVRTSKCRLWIVDDKATSKERKCAQAKFCYKLLWGLQNPESSHFIVL